eukprot:gene38309-33114_t
MGSALGHSVDDGVIPLSPLPSTEADAVKEVEFASEWFPRAPRPTAAISPVEFRVTKRESKVGVSYLGTQLKAVNRGGAAEAAGLKVGMYILRVNGTEVRTDNDVSAAFRDAPDAPGMFTIVAGEATAAGCAVGACPSVRRIDVDTEHMRMIFFDAGRCVQLPRDATVAAPILSRLRALAEGAGVAHNIQHSLPDRREV